MVRKDFRSSIVSGTRSAAALLRAHGHRLYCLRRHAATDPTPQIDHFCALVKDYKPDEMRAAIEKAGITMGTGRLGMPTDDDGIRLQLLGVPGGLARTIIPSTRITTDDAAVAAVGLDHIALAVSDISRVRALRAVFRTSSARKPTRFRSRSRIHGWSWNRSPLAPNPPSSGSASASPASIEKRSPRSCRSLRWRQLPATMRYVPRSERLYDRINRRTAASLTHLMMRWPSSRVVARGPS